jgi:hypothetical protein
MLDRKDSILRAKDRVKNRRAFKSPGFMKRYYSNPQVKKQDRTEELLEADEGYAELDSTLTSATLTM